MPIVMVQLILYKEVEVEVSQDLAQALEGGQGDAYQQAATFVMERAGELFRSAEEFPSSAHAYLQDADGDVGAQLFDIDLFDIDY